ncbi:MAG: hypothetical protein GYA15_14600 [Leptolinea sp.]|jgi:hypothetical protein|nr:hypothetical protein [Leptolinea sp.]
MEIANNSKRTLAAFGWGALFIWWGVSFIYDPITIGLCAAGSGVILLGVNITRLLMGIPANRSTHDWGVIALVWGTLDHFLKPTFEQSFAMLFIVLGAVIVSTMLARKVLDRSQGSSEL